MADQPKHSPALENEIAHLRDLDLAELKRRWLALYACPAPKFFRREHLIRAIGHRMQTDAFGDLKLSTQRLLRTIVDAVRTGKEDGVVPAPRIRPGTKLIRVWQGKTHIVSALDDGFEWQGSRYRSLSAVARAITGTKWNGLVFFGAKPRQSGSKTALKRKATLDA